MKKLVIASLIAVAVAVPSQAQENPSKFSKIYRAPLGAIGVMYGAMVGIPVKIAHEVASETSRMTATLQDDFDTRKDRPYSQARLCVYGLAVPYGIASGTILGSIRGMEAAVKYGYDRPFSSQSISLGDDEVAMKIVPEKSQ